MNFKTTLLAAVATVGLAAGAYAAPVTGQISVTGFAQAAGSVGFGSATGVSFANAAGTSVSGSSGSLNGFGGGSGSFAAIGSCGSFTTGCGTIQNIASFSTSPPIASFLTLTGGSTQGATTVSFDLTSVTNLSNSSATGTTSFTGVGFINFSGMDRTAGQFLFSAQGNNIVSFSATTLASSVSTPEPASLAILGGSLAALGMIRRRKRG